MLQMVIALLIAIGLLGMTYKLCPSLIAFIAKRLRGGAQSQSGGDGTEAETAPLMGDVDESDSMAM